MPDVSIITPVYNEQDNVEELVTRIVDAIKGCGRSFEIIAVNDGSKDASLARLERLTSSVPELVIIDLSRNYGQTAALQAALDQSRGQIIVPIDADLQNDPADIPVLLKKLDEGYDVASGWRRDRKDDAIKRNFLSRVANRMISVATGVHLHDHGCTLKAYRRSVVENVRLYGEMHRFVSVYASWYGNRITEIPVNHHPRTAGTSNYGLERIFKVLLDLVVVRFLQGAITKPIYWFGGFGLFFLAIGVLSGALALVLKIGYSVSFILTPLPLIATMGFMLGVICFLIGLVAEIQMRVYFESQDKRPYNVRSVMRSESAK